MWPPLLAAGVSFTPGVPQPPLLPPAFRQSIRTTGFFGAARPHAVGVLRHMAANPRPDVIISFWFDNTTSTVKQFLNLTEAGFVSSTWSLYHTQNDSLQQFIQFADDCRPAPPSFSLGATFDISWLPRATYAGPAFSAIADAGAVDVFVYTDTRTTHNYSVAARDGKLVYVNATWYGHLPGTGSGVMDAPKQYFFVDDMTVGPQPPELFNVPVEGCYEKVPPCAEGRVQTMTVYLAHPNKYRYLDDEDTGDARGDLMFLCPDMSVGISGFNLYDAVSAWSVEVDTHWGQYKQCNGYPGLCFGLEDYYIGRQVPYGSRSEPMSGQCTAHAATGFWFNMPKGGKCGAWQTVGVDCSWRPVERLKTISLECLSTRRQMTTTCKLDSFEGKLAGKGVFDWVYNRSLPVFERAFATEDEDHGGCPAI